MFINLLVRLARSIHVLSAFWVLVLGCAIVADAISRGVFSTPIQGTTEVIKNSVVAITFLQLPLAIFSGSMLRTEILADALNPLGRKLLRTLAFLMGMALFAIIAYASIPEAMTSYRIGAYEGEGALRVPTWPVRFLIIVTSVFAAIAYLTMIWLDWLDKLEFERSYPGILSFDAQAASVMQSGKKGDQ